ncbi:hypothetical protein BN946_scf184798.g106 [Trametes cinnabarina]|uniref:Uncharacterized protein n=1 Tax=Pycnoporus cinnabarinus TaxID=5643 RepID=A0A060S9B6_PYCCI|nr:hypothetical protein BN946_scf184798.g106 [Trametes cinnabarina]
MRQRPTHRYRPSWIAKVALPDRSVPGGSPSVCLQGPQNLTYRTPSTSCRSEGSQRPSPALGYALAACSVLFLLVGSYAVFFSAFLPRTGIWVRTAAALRIAFRRVDETGASACSQALDVLAEDRHYKYLVIMLIPAGTGFVIANWVGWQYYMNS